MVPGDRRQVDDAAAGLAQIGGERARHVERTVEVHTRHVLMKLDLPEDDLANRRVLAALTHLRTM